MRRAAAVAAAAFLASTVAVACRQSPPPSTVPAPPAPRTARPNVLLLLTDDQRWDSLDQMPRLAADPSWARFDDFFVNESECCPSRATILTGRYSHHTGVQSLLTGVNLDDRTTVATLLQGAGYRTGLLGKYLNDYPFVGRPTYVPPGWDTFVAATGAVDYYDYELSDKGSVEKYGSRPEDYSTDVLTKKATAFLDSTDASKPFYLEVAYGAPHFRPYGFPPVGAPRHAGVCADRTFPVPPNFNSRDRNGEPPWLIPTPDVSPDGALTRLRAQCESLRTVDESVDTLLTDLRRSGRLDNTYVVFLSDNGFGFGEHRLMGKGHLYDESLRVPLWVKGPGINGGSTKRLTSNIDVMPTVLDWTGVAPPAGFLDGHSFAAAARGETVAGEPTEILLRGCRTMKGMGSEVCGGDPTGFGLAWGLRTRTEKYVEYADGYRQLFDLVADPFEMANLALDPANAGRLQQLQDRMAALRGPYTDPPL